MPLRRLFTATLLTLALGSLVYTFVLSQNKSGVITSPTRPGQDTIIAVQDVHPDYAVYFFYNDIYCSTCEKLEHYALSTIQKAHPESLTLGTLQWRTLDMRTPENKHYVEDFGLYSKSIVLVAFEDGAIVRFENLEAIWDKVGDETEYRQYIQESLKTFMDETHE